MKTPSSSEEAGGLAKVTNKLIAESQPELNPAKPACAGHLFPQREEVRPVRVHRAVTATPQSRWPGSLRAEHSCLQQQ